MSRIVKQLQHAVRFSLICCMTSLAACGGSTSAPTISVTGTWTLQSINGGLPYSIVSGSTTTSYTGSTLTILPNGTYNEIVSYKVTQGSATQTGTLTELGTYEAVNGSITFHDQTDQTTYNGSVSGNTLTEIVNGFTQVYARR